MNPGLGRSPGEGKGYPSSILAWRVHGVARLSNFHFIFTKEVLTILKAEITNGGKWSTTQHNKNLVFLKQKKQHGIIIKSILRHLNDSLNVKSGSSPY